MNRYRVTLHVSDKRLCAPACVASSGIVRTEYNYAMLLSGVGWIKLRVGYGCDYVCSALIARDEKLASISGGAIRSRLGHNYALSGNDRDYAGSPGCTGCDRRSEFPRERIGSDD